MIPLADARSAPGIYAMDTLPPTADDPSRASWYDLTKTGLNWMMALTLFILTAPLMVLSACLVKLTSRGTIIYSQIRLGRDGKPFPIYKFRTMYQDCELQSGARWSTPGDARVTPLGRFLRKTHLDELPQLWNVLRGDMSLVGPRPERPEFVPQLELVLPRYRERLAIRPGVSGLAQVQLPPDTDLDSVRRKLAHDLFYVNHRSFWLDFRILIGTALNMIGISHAVSRRFLALPGGQRVERAYVVSLAELLRPTPSESESTPSTTAAAALMPELQPA
jgi:lipopolysaccharide/colanic/teichoic acid biosynthesis glycosyltransferase